VMGYAPPDPLPCPPAGPRMPISAPLASRAGSRRERSPPKMGVIVPSAEPCASVRTFIVVFEDGCSRRLRRVPPRGAFVADRSNRSDTGTGGPMRGGP